MKRTRKNGWLTAVVMVVFIISAVRAFGGDAVREPVVRFIDFYVAAEKANAPISVWERIVYGVALARTPSPVAAQSCPLAARSAH